jgi:hypothetical protein
VRKRGEISDKRGGINEKRGGISEKRRGISEKRGGISEYGEKENGEVCESPPKSGHRNLPSADFLNQFTKNICASSKGTIKKEGEGGMAKVRIEEGERRHASFHEVEPLDFPSGDFLNQFTKAIKANGHEGREREKRGGIL